MKIQFNFVILLLGITFVAVATAGETGSKENPEKPVQKKKCTGGPNDKWTDCGSACPLTCEKPKRGLCTKQCVTNTCECKEGYVRHKNGKCVKPEECPKPDDNETEDCDEKCTKKCTGGPHDKCTLCGSACPLTCDKPERGVCTEECKVNVCECEDGYVRAPDGQCVKAEDCPLKCPTKCKGGPHDKCVRYDCEKNICRCDPGYVRCPKGNCIKPDKCPKKDICDDESKEVEKCTAKCTGGKHDKCTLCGEYCPPSCADPKRKSCSKKCAKNVCRCEKGYLRDATGKCVKESQCPKLIKKKEKSSHESESEEKKE